MMTTAPDPKSTPDHSADTVPADTGSPANSQEQAWPDLAGRLIRRDGEIRHLLPIRVYFEDTDFSGVVYHASYLRWCERGRSDFLRLLGNDHNALLGGQDGREAAAFVVRRMGLEFLRPARIDDVLEVETRAGSIGAASIDLQQTIRIQSSETIAETRAIFEATVTVVLVSLSGKPMRISTALRSAFQH